MTDDKEERMLILTKEQFDQLHKGYMRHTKWLNLDWDELPLAPKHTETEYNILLATAQMSYHRLDCVPWCQCAGGGDDCSECPSGTEEGAWTKPCSKCGHYHHCLETILKLDAHIKELETDAKIRHDALVRHEDRIQELEQKQCP